MSTYWKLHCLDCSSDAGDCHTFDTQDPKMLIDAWNHREALSALTDADFEILFANNKRVPLCWFREHREHNVQAQSEYDTLLSDCATYGKPDYFWCHRQKGHGGACQPLRDYIPHKLP